MVKKIQLQGIIEFAQPQAVFSYVFGDDQFIKRYHKKYNDDPYAEVTSWDEEGMREVKFIALLEAPKMIKKIVGAGNFRVKDVQKYTRCDNCFTITSQPALDLPGGDRFVTLGETILSTDEKAGCAVIVNITLEFKAAVWGVQGAVESFMESQARTSFARWMAMARLFCQEKMGVSESAQGLENEDQDEFFDIEECTLSDISFKADESEQIGEMSRLFSGYITPFCRNEESSPGLQVWFVERVLKDLSLLQISSEASRSHLEKLNAKLLKMEDDMFHIRSHLEKPQSFLSKKTDWSLYGVGIATGLAIGFVYLKTKRQT